jgi:hypothetical protein
VRIGNVPLALWTDVLVAQTAPATVSAPLVFLGTPTDEEITRADLQGKAVVIQASPAGLNLNVSLPERRYPGYVLRKYSAALLAKGAAAIVFVADEWGERSWPQVLPALRRGTYDLEGGPSAVIPAKVPVLWVHAGALEGIRAPGATLQADIQVEHFQYPSVNIVARVAGTDPALSKEHVLFSGHQDHDGIRQPYGPDSVYNGADDNATVSVAMLAVARPLAKPGNVGAFLCGIGEERGPAGLSRWLRHWIDGVAIDVVPTFSTW